MPKKQKQKIEVSLPDSARDREVVLDALQTVSNPGKKIENVKTSVKKKNPEEIKVPNAQFVVNNKVKKSGTSSVEKTKNFKMVVQKKEQILKNNSHGRREHYWLKTLPFFFVILILGLICFLQAGLYFTPSIRSAAENIADRIYYPVAIIGAHVITFHDVQTERDLLHAYTKAGFSFAQSETTLDSLTINKIIRDVYLQKGKKEYSVNVSDAVIEQAFVNLFGAQSTSQDARIVSQLTLGLNPQEIKDNVIKPYVEKIAFSDALLNDPKFLQQQKNIAEQLRIDLSKNPSGFTNENKYTSLAVKFYDLGYIPMSSLTGSFASVASLEVGQISDVIEDARSYSLFRVTEKLPTTNDPQGEYVSLQKIEIKKIDADLWIDTQLQSIHVAVFDPYVSWNNICLQVTPDDSCMSVSSNKNNSVSLDSLYEALMGDSSIFLPSFSDLNK